MEADRSAKKLHLMSGKHYSRKPMRTSH